MLLTSPAALLDKNGAVMKPLADVLIDSKKSGIPVGLISNKPEPLWFEAVFGGTGVQFLKVTGRQDGAIVKFNAKKMGLSHFDALVLAAKDEDVQMGKNGQAVLVAAGWSSSPPVIALGIRVNNADELREVIRLSSNWSERWWYEAAASRYSVKALADLSGYGKAFDQQQLASQLTSAVKNGGGKLNALLAITSRSLLASGFGSAKNLLWGTYPSSSSKNNDTEILSEFTHRLRTTVSRVRFTKHGEPLFIRHKASVKRSSAPGAVRTDPTDQVLSLHLNPFYKTRLAKRNVIVIDDCTTYGASFGVAAALLLKGGAASVTGIALGKFGNQIRDFEIIISGDPFSPLDVDDFEVRKISPLTASASFAAQQSLRTLLM
jgi:hypothetical protein